MSSKRFEEMEVWLAAIELAEMVYSDFSSCRDFSFVDQIKRAAVSVSNNIAEGSERQTPLDFARFLDIAKGSSGEVRSMYHLALRLGFVSAEVQAVRLEQCVSINKQLAGFAKYLRSLAP